MNTLNHYLVLIFRIAFLAICIFCIPFTGAAQLSGNYTIDPAGAAFDPVGTPYPNFKSFAEAVDTLRVGSSDWIKCCSCWIYCVVSG